MSLSLIGLLTENTDRIFHGDIGHSRSTGLMNRGFKPYRAIQGELVPAVKPLNTKDYTNMSDEKLTLYFLSDEEFQKAQEVANKIKDLKSKYEQQIQNVNNILPSFIQHKLLGSESTQKVESSTNDAGV